MTDPAQSEVVATLEDDTGDRIVDVLRHPEGHFTYVEYARDTEDVDAWHARADQTEQTFPSEFAAYSAAMRDVEWLMD